MKKSERVKDMMNANAMLTVFVVKEKKAFVRLLDGTTATTTLEIFEKAKFEMEHQRIADLGHVQPSTCERRRI